MTADFSIGGGDATACVLAIPAGAASGGRIYINLLYERKRMGDAGKTDSSPIPAA